MRNNIITILTIIFIVSLNNILFSQEIPISCSKSLVKVEDGGDIYFRTFKDLKIESIYKKKKHNINFSIVQFEQAMSLFFKFEKNICFDVGSRLVITLRDSSEITVISRMKEKNCEGQLYYTLSHVSDVESIKKINEKSIESLKIYNKKDKITLDISEYELANISQNIYCLAKIFNQTFWNQD